MGDLDLVEMFYIENPFIERRPMFQFDNQLYLHYTCMLFVSN